MSPPASLFPAQSTIEHVSSQSHIPFDTMETCVSALHALRATLVQQLDIVKSELDDSKQRMQQNVAQKLVTSSPSVNDIDDARPLRSLSNLVPRVLGWQPSMCLDGTRYDSAGTLSSPPMSKSVNHGGNCSSSMLASVFACRPSSVACFRPSRAALERSSFADVRLPQQDGCVSTFMPLGHAVLLQNARYLGSTGGCLDQVSTITEQENCAVWITGLPTNATIKDLLNAIRKIGRVFSTHMNHAGDMYTKNAAKLVFCLPEAAQKFLFLANTIGIYVLGQRLRAVHNRYRYRAHSRQHESRVLHIRGPTQFVNIDFLGLYIQSLIVADVLAVVDIAVAPADAAMGIREQIWEFGSLGAQAAALKVAIEREPAMMGLVFVTFLSDPCE